MLIPRRKHLFNDLRPYTCIHHECTFSAHSFPDRQTWSNHLELDHKLGPEWQNATCPLCLEPTGIGKSAVLIHFARHMEDIALAALPRETESEDGSEDNLETNSDDNVTTSDYLVPTNNNLHTIQDATSKPGTAIDSEGKNNEYFICSLCPEPTQVRKSGFRIHLARHTDAIALAALPRDIESEAKLKTYSDDNFTNDPQNIR
jgi:hypothetical protein